MPLASCVNYIQGLLDGMAWPEGMQNLTSPPPPLACYITPPDPNVLSGTPSAYVWFNRGTESRNPAKYGAGTIPRAAYSGAPSGTKALDHTIPVYLVWTGGSPTDPEVNRLFPGMVDAVMDTLRSSADPVIISDPWTGQQSELVDVGENQTWLTDLRALEPMRSERLDALIEVSVVEIISA